MATRSKRHHVVPRFYLDRWADKDRRVYVVDHAAGRNHVASTADVAVRKDFYTLEAEDGSKSDDFENILATIEGKAAEVFRSIDQGVWPLDHDQRVVMANFVAMQLARLPSLREVLDQGLTDVNRLVVEHLLTDESAFEQMICDVVGPDATDEDRTRYREALAEPHETKLTGAGFVSMMVEGIDEVLQPIFDMRWTLVTADDGEFITSDRPVFHWAHPSWPEHVPVGLLTAERTHIPLGRRQILVMQPRVGTDHQPDNEETMLAPGVRIVNAHAILASGRLFVAHPSWASRSEVLFSPIGPEHLGTTL